MAVKAVPRLRSRWRRAARVYSAFGAGTPFANERRLRSPIPFARTLLALFAATAFGCGAMLESSRVERDFHSSFACPVAQVSSSMNGYRVEGCGTTAYYACICTDSGSRHAHNHDDTRSGTGIVATVLVGALFAGLDADECALSHVERGPRGPAVVALAQTPHTLAGERAVRSKLPVRGGALVLFGKPARAPDHVLLDVHANTRLREGPCEPRLFEDGARVPVLQHQRVDPYTERMLLPRSALAHTKSSVRFAGQVCGFGFELEDMTRKSVALFDARFGELTGGPATAAR